jgi:hypothetical protein
VDVNDNISETPGLIPYPHHIGSAVVKPININTFKNKGIDKFNREVESRVEKLNEEYQKIVQEIEWNQMIYESEFNFEPLIGDRYYLYERKNKKNFLSVIPPKNWRSMVCLGTFIMDENYKWKKII